MSNKLTFTGAMKSMADTLVSVKHTAEDLDSIYFDRGYNSGGADEIVDGDISTLDVTAADVAAGITMVQQLKNFFENTAVTQGDYDNTLNKLRSTP